MFGQKKNPVESSKRTLVLRAYLRSGYSLIGGKLNNPRARAAVQVFVLGMVDMLRQTYQLDWSKFVDVYSEALIELDLRPVIGAAALVQSVENIAQHNQSVQQLMKHGAQSMRLYMVSQDAEAPVDLLAAASYGEKSGNALQELINI